MTATFEMRPRCCRRLTMLMLTQSTVDSSMSPWIGDGPQHARTQGLVTGLLKLIGGKTRLSAARASRGTGAIVYNSVNDFRPVSPSGSFV